MLDGISNIGAYGGRKSNGALKNENSTSLWWIQSRKTAHHALPPIRNRLHRDWWSKHVECVRLGQRAREAWPTFCVWTNAERTQKRDVSGMIGTLCETRLVKIFSQGRRINKTHRLRLILSIEHGIEHGRTPKQQGGLSQSGHPSQCDIRHDVPRTTRRASRFVDSTTTWNGGVLVQYDDFNDRNGRFAAAVSSCAFCSWHGWDVVFV